MQRTYLRANLPPSRTPTQRPDEMCPGTSAGGSKSKARLQSASPYKEQTVSQGEYGKPRLLPPLAMRVNTSPFSSSTLYTTTTE